MATRRKTAAGTPKVSIGDAAQMEQIRQSLARVAADAATAAAKEAISGFFLTLGYDVTKPDTVIKLQQMFGFLGEMHATRETIRVAAWRSAVGLLVTGALSALGVGIHAYFTRPSVILALMLASSSVAHAV